MIEARGPGSDLPDLLEVIDGHARLELALLRARDGDQAVVDDELALFEEHRQRRKERLRHVDVVWVVGVTLVVADQRRFIMRA